MLLFCSNKGADTAAGVVCTPGGDPDNGDFFFRLPPLISDPLRCGSGVGVGWGSLCWFDNGVLLEVLVVVRLSLPSLLAGGDG